MKEQVMKRVDTFTYDVLPNEKITIKVTPTNLGGSLPSVVAALDGKVSDLPNVGTNSAPVYKFTVTKQLGPPLQVHRVKMEFTFQIDSPDEAFYMVAISGQNDVGCPCGFTVAKADAQKSATIRFRVKAAQ
jgi:hypothetical protein